MAGSSVDPLSSGIGAVGSLIGGLFSAAAERKRQQRDLAEKMRSEATGIQTGAAQQLTQGEVNALQNLQNVYQKSLGL